VSERENVTTTRSSCPGQVCVLGWGWADGRQGRAGRCCWRHYFTKHRTIYGKQMPRHRMYAYPPIHARTHVLEYIITTPNKPKAQANAPNTTRTLRHFWRHPVPAIALEKPNCCATLSSPSPTLAVVTRVRYRTLDNHNGNLRSYNILRHLIVNYHNMSCHIVSTRHWETQRTRSIAYLIPILAFGFHAPVQVPKSPGMRDHKSGQ
jgi:hypothetical protein